MTDSPQHIGLLLITLSVIFWLYRKRKRTRRQREDDAWKKRYLAKRDQDFEFYRERNERQQKEFALSLPNVGDRAANRSTGIILGVVERSEIIHCGTHQTRYVLVGPYFVSINDTIRIPPPAKESPAHDQTSPPTDPAA